MAKKTSVELTENAQKIKNELVKAFGLKNILSAGLFVLNKLSTLDVSRIVSEVNEDFVEFDPYADRYKLIGVSTTLSEAEDFLEQNKTLDQMGVDNLRDLLKEMRNQIGDPEIPTDSIWHIDIDSPFISKLEKLVLLYRDDVGSGPSSALLMELKKFFGINGAENNPDQTQQSGSAGAAEEAAKSAEHASEVQKDRHGHRTA